MAKTARLKDVRWWARLGGVAIGALVLLVVGRLVVVLLEVARQGQRSPGQRLAEGQILVGTLTVLLTLVVAASTLWYAALTRALVRSSEEQLDAVQKQTQIAHRELEFARASLVAASRALLVDVPWGLHPVADNSRQIRFPGHANPVGIRDRGQALTPTSSASHSSLYVPVRNVGAGTAVITGVNVSTGPGLICDGTMSPAIVPPGEMSELVFGVPHDRTDLSPLASALNDRTPVSVHVHYTNSTGEDPLQTRLDLVGAAEERFMRVSQVALFQRGSQEPFAESGPSDP